LKNVNVFDDIKFILRSLVFFLCLNVCMH
jgi:hypothetical protein